VEESGTLEHDEIDKAKRVEEMIEYVKKKKVKNAYPDSRR
tara:strand:+ start:2493 stop:2612 length:120 start_codon:yes stop_codon:yes gene_type:complete